MSKKYVALDGNVFVKEKKIEHKIGAFTIPDNLDIDYTFGTVVSAGPGSYENGQFCPNNLKIGDEIVFPRTVGSKTHFNDGEELILVRACDVIGRLEEYDDAALENIEKEGE